MPPSNSLPPTVLLPPSHFTKASGPQLQAPEPFKAANPDQKTGLERLAGLSEAAQRGDKEAYTKFAEHYSAFSAANDRAIADLDDQIGQLSDRLQVTRQRQEAGQEWLKQAKTHLERDRKSVV